MPDIQFEPMVAGVLNDLLDYLKSNPQARGIVTALTEDMVRVTIRIESVDKIRTWRVGKDPDDTSDPSPGSAVLGIRATDRDRGAM